ncbi:hypothetical protein LTR37_009207 [Vermiconidia calcicola]|uniref:Uncharacterized protein n=1 Tax=Vermiconidia calcicola TaxID=1690605 RepID=A0ACC3N9Z6_9PEZI|nr:hypothetical protein LTR37_009207 [Vermiconidia calcicola]
MPFDPSKDIPDLSGKVIFISGGTAGIGRTTVLALVLHNPSHVYFTGRNAKAGADVVSEANRLAPKCKVTFIPCDLSSSRKTIRDALLEHFRSARLDLFIANAGIMAVAPSLTAEGFEAQFGTNYFGHAILLHLLRPAMLRTAEASNDSDVRFVVLSSSGHALHHPGGIQFDKLKMPDSGSPWQRYGQSKLADILLAKNMAKHFPQITSVSVHPGLVTTRLGERAQPSLMMRFLTLLSWTPLSVTAEEGAHNTLWAAMAPKNTLENGAYYKPVGKLPAKKSLMSGVAAICSDEDLADRLWEWTETELEGLEHLPQH